MFVVLIGELVEQPAVGVGQELVRVEGETDRVVFDPLLLLQLVLLDLLQVVAEFVISNDVTIGTFRVLDAVGVVIVLGRCLNYVAFSCQVIQHGNVIWHLRGLVFLDIKHVELFLKGYLVVAEKVVWEEADDLVPVFLPILNHHLDALD
jgi:hypothetical protein